MLSLSLQFAAAGDKDGRQGHVFVIYADFGDLLEDILTANQVAKDGVFAVQVGAGFQCDEEPESCQEELPV